MDNNELSTLLREWFDNHSLIESIGQRDEYYRCHACKKGAWLRNEINHTDDYLLVRTEKALHPLQVVAKPLDMAKARVLLTESIEFYNWHTYYDNGADYCSHCRADIRYTNGQPDESTCQHKDDCYVVQVRTLLGQG